MMVRGESWLSEATREVSLTTCDREPIHIPGSIQPHGVLLVLSDDLSQVIQASENTNECLGIPFRDVVGHAPERTLGQANWSTLERGLAALGENARPIFVKTLTIRSEGQSRTFHAVAHRSTGGVILELELGDAEGGPAEVVGDDYPLVDAFTLHAEESPTVAELSQVTAASIRVLTGFDRVLVYRFDEDGSGTVVGEDCNGKLPELLHHRFPASDIPAQARELYRVNRLRMIPDAGYRPVPIVPTLNPVTGRPLDMSFAVLRSVSPIHVEYMRNMETASSMSISIIRGGKLWGLISCHHTTPKRVPFPVRGTCDLFARAFSLRLTALEHADRYERRMAVRSAYSTLFAMMTDRGDFAAALAEHPAELLSFANAQGAAIVTEAGTKLIGKCPTEKQVHRLADWLFADVKREVFSTDCLANVFVPANEFTATASGVLAVAVSKLHPSYVFWFRPEVVRTIPWGGDPTLSKGVSGDKIQPRRSFETWKETVRQRSAPWDPSEIEGAAELRNAIVGIVLRKAEELAELNAELTRSNKELEAFSYSVSHDLRAPLRHIVGYAEMLRESKTSSHSETDLRCINTIIESSEYAGRLVDKLLNYSRLGRAELQKARVDLNLLVRELQRDVMRDAEGRRVEWKIATLPTVVADLMMLRMAVRDLLSNAIKYTRGKDVAVIEIGSLSRPGEVVVFVKDNGVGFDMAYVDKLFGVFQRLHRWEEYEGTGIGLANVRRVIERHGGRTWAEGQEGVGATFSFALPDSKGGVADGVVADRGVATDE